MKVFVIGAWSNRRSRPPEILCFYGRGDLCDIAATYAFHIAEAQAFWDGNKRTAVAAALTFLRGNEVALKIDELEIYNAMIAIAEKRMTKADLAGIFRRHAQTK